MEVASLVGVEEEEFESHKPHYEALFLAPGRREDGFGRDSSRVMVEWVNVFKWMDKSA